MGKRPHHHPPVSGTVLRPWSDKPRLLHGSTGAVGGYGERSFYVAAVTAREAREIIRANHYSKTVVANSYVHLGVHIGGVLVGVLQFGYGLNPIRLSKVVSGTGATDYLELNRMWLSDEAPRNSESRAISYSIQFIRAAMPHVRWLQSFADERCGALGTVYQAANFIYVGSHMSLFYELDGEIFHQIIVTAHKKGGGRGQHLRSNLDRATKLWFRQFRYVYFIHKGARRHLLMPSMPYPKRGRSVGTT